VYAGYYTGNNEANNPLISPLLAGLRNLPPIYLQTGENEILLDVSVRFYEKARQVGVDVTLKIWEGMFHVFQLFSFLPETAESFKHFGNFINRLCHERT
jgi:monoterpene epsilon-lactone hydrolase